MTFAKLREYATIFYVEIVKSSKKPLIETAIQDCTPKLHLFRLLSVYFGFCYVQIWFSNTFVSFNQSKLIGAEYRYKLYIIW